ncbi:MAG: HAMP domain-containing histidine kinase, partial [Deferribacteres bacterium]|nr:HAMP domain-containing histidine kinase [Deferribacteres bacterium]
MAGEINEEQRDQLQRVYASAKHLLLLITDVIDISKIEVGEIEVFVEEFPLQKVVEDAVSSLRTQIEDKGLEVEVDVSPDIRLKTDSRRLLQCILNYLSNAVKFTEKGRVSISARRVKGPGSKGLGPEKPAVRNPQPVTENFVEIAVSDTGIGIKEEELPKLFNSFVRLDSHLKIITPGTGLGLYLTKKLATEVLGGSVYAESRHGEGSTFVLRIPEELDPLHLKRLSSLE